MAGTDLAVVDKAPVRRSRKEEPSVTLTDKAWMAAVIDLKGGIIRKSNKMRKTPQLVLYVNSKDARVALRLSALTGTAPEQHPSPPPEQFMRRNCAEHCITPHVHVGENPWNMPVVTRWTVTGASAAVILLNLAPFMSTYEDYAGHVAEMVANTVTQGQGAGMVRASVSRLEQLGWDIPPRLAARLKEGTEGK